MMRMKHVIKLLEHFVWMTNQNNYLILDLIFYLNPWRRESRSQKMNATVHKLVYTEKMLQTRLIQGIKETRVSWEISIYEKT